MGEAVRTVDHPRWGPAEKAAIDRCLAIPGPPSAGPGRRPPRLSRLIETEIIPRLMLAHRSEPLVANEARQARIGTAEVAELASLCLAADSQRVLGFVAGLADRGHAIDAILLDALGGAARLLGDMWREDLCTFADVTIGLATLQGAVRSPLFEFDGTADSPPSGRILLAAVPGEQHRFGTSVLETIFRRGGWDATAVETADEMCDLLRSEWYDVVGLSLSSDVLFDRVRPTIQSLRRASRNRDLFVMVGGRFFVDHPERAPDAGADTAAIDAHDALSQAQLRCDTKWVRC